MILQAVFTDQEIVDLLDYAVEHHTTIQDLIHNSVMEAIFR